MAQQAPPYVTGGWLDPAAPAFVGREPELARLRRSWDAALSGHRQLVLLLGDPGTGKSRLAAQVCQLWAANATVLVGRCLPDAPVAYEPFVDPVAALMGIVRQAPGVDADPGVAQALAALVPEAATQAPVELASEVFDAVASVLAAAATQKPIVLVIEDLHWATATTLALLSWLAARLGDAKVLIVVTARNNPPDRTSKLTATLAAVCREPGVHRIEMSGLPTPDVEAFLRSDGQPPAVLRLSDELHDQTGGNPFLLREICREIRATRWNPIDADGHPRVPQSVRDIFHVRLAELTDEQRKVIELAAVLGEQVSWHQLDSATRSDWQTLPAMDRALELGILISDPTGANFRFPHALARHSVLEEIPPGRLAGYHARAAELLEARGGKGLADVQQLAHHYRNCLGQHEKARHYLLAAAELAGRALAWAEAAKALQQAAELTQDADERHHLLLLAVDCLQTSDLIVDARELAREVADQAVDPAIRLEAAMLEEREATLVGGDARTVRRLAQALREYPFRDMADPIYWMAVAGLVRGLAQLGDAGDYADATALQDALLHHARTISDPEMMAYLLANWLPADFGRPRQTAEMLAQAWELSRLAREVDDGAHLGASGYHLALLGLRAGDQQAVRTAVADYEVAARSGYPLHTYWPLLMTATSRFMAGDFAGAEALARRAYDKIRDRFGFDGVGHYGLQVLMIRTQTCELGDLGERIHGAEDPEQFWAPGLLSLYTQLRMARPAAALLARMAAPGAMARHSRHDYQPTAIAFMVEAALFLHDEQMLRLLRPHIAERSGQNVVSEQFLAYHGAADRYLALIDSELGTGDPLQLLDAAAELDQRGGSRVGLGLTLTARMMHLARSLGPQSPQVALAAAEAEATALPIGHRKVLDTVTQFRKNQSPGRRPPTPTTLSARELEVLELLVQGASNSEIARALYISPNTAANHVRAILTKTGTTNRTQAATLGIARGWVTGNATKQPAKES